MQWCNPQDTDSAFLLTWICSASLSTFPRRLGNVLSTSFLPWSQSCIVLVLIVLFQLQLSSQLQFLTSGLSCMYYSSVLNLMPQSLSQSWLNFLPTWLLQCNVIIRVSGSRLNCNNVRLRMIADQKYFEKIAKVYSVSLLLISNFIVTSVLRQQNCYRKCDREFAMNLW